MSARYRLTSAVDRLRAGAEEATLLAEPAWRRTTRLLSAQAERTRRLPLAWGTLYVALFCALSMLLLDRPLALLLKATVGGDIEGFFRIITNLGRAELYLIPAGVFGLAYWWAARRALLPHLRRTLLARAWRSAYLFATVAIAGLSVDLVKVVVGRARPQVLFEQGFYGAHPLSTTWAWYSFPSGHSVAAGAAMAALTVLVPGYRFAWLAIALLVMASRVMLTAHYLSDTVAGAWIGVVVAVLLARQARRREIEL